MEGRKLFFLLRAQFCGDKTGQIGCTGTGAAGPVYLVLLNHKYTWESPGGFRQNTYAGLILKTVSQSAELGEKWECP